MSPDDEAQRGSLEIHSPTEAAPCHTQTRQPVSIGISRRFLIFRYQTALAGPPVPGDDDADMVRASSLACGGDFLLRLAGCQGKDLIPQG